jgi:hypothetical protein
MAFGRDAPGNTKPAQTLQGGVNPMSAGLVNGAVPNNGLTYVVSGFWAFEEITAAKNKIAAKIFFCMIFSS